MNRLPVDYLRAEALHLRAERAERLARVWRIKAWLMLALLMIATWLTIDSTRLLVAAREANRKAAAAEQQTRAELRATQSDFRRCKGANEGLFEGIREQQQLLNEAIEVAKRCRV